MKLSGDEFDKVYKTFVWRCLYLIVCSMSNRCVFVINCLSSKCSLKKKQTVPMKVDKLLKLLKVYYVVAP